MPRRKRDDHYKRRGPVREPYDTVLIVCEGEKTEPNYFQGLRDTYRLSSANIAVVSAPGTDPMSIADHAEAQLAKFDRVFCVFDRDGHANYAAAVHRIESSPAGRQGRWHAIVCTPCFELWILFHFQYTTAAFTAVGKNSACDNVIREVKKHLPEYVKKQHDIYGKLHDATDNALKHATRLEQHNRDTGSRNPETRVHRLVDYLRKLKS